MAQDDQRKPRLDRDYWEWAVGSIAGAVLLLIIIWNMADPNSLMRRTFQLPSATNAGSAAPR